MYTVKYGYRASGPRRGANIITDPPTRPDCPTGFEISFSRSYMYTSVGTPLSRVVFRCPRLYLLDYSSNQRMPMCQGDRNGSKGEFWVFIRGTQRFFFGFLGWDLFFKIGSETRTREISSGICLRFEGVTFCWRRSSCCRISFTAGSKTWFSRGIWSQ